MNDNDSEQGIMSDQQADYVSVFEQFWPELEASGYKQDHGSDTAIAKPFTQMQKVMEETFARQLESGKIQAFIEIIHTPRAPTPLRTEVSTPAEELSETLGVAEHREQAVHDRSSSVRRVLANGGFVYALYPQESVAETPGMDVFEAVKREYPDTLVDFPVERFDSEKTGATYLIRDENGVDHLFSLQADQAHDPADGREWKMWYGPLIEQEHPLYEKDRTKYKRLNDRFHEIEDWMEGYDLDIEDELERSAQYLAKKRGQEALEDIDIDVGEDAPSNFEGNEQAMHAQASLVAQELSDQLIQTIPPILSAAATEAQISQLQTHMAGMQDQLAALAQAHMQRNMDMVQSINEEFAALFRAALDPMTWHIREEAQELEQQQISGKGQ